PRICGEQRYGLADRFSGLGPSPRARGAVSVTWPFYQRQAAVFATSRKTDKPDITRSETNSCHPTYDPPRSPATHTSGASPHWVSEAAKDRATEHLQTTLRATNPTPHQPHAKPDDSPPGHHVLATPPTPRHTTR